MREPKYLNVSIIEKRGNIHGAEVRNKFSTFMRNMS